MAISITKPTVGGSADIWGDTLNTGLEAIESTLNGTGTGKVRIEPDLTSGSWSISGTAVTATAAELNILDGVTSTATELSIVDGDTAATATTLVDADRIVVNDDGTMVQVAMTDLVTYFNANAAITSSGALDSGSITSGFGAIDNGSSNITTTGTISFGTLTDGTTSVTAILDEDDMASDSATAVPTQQSVKAYVDDLITYTGTAPIFGVRAFCVWDGTGLTGSTTTQAEGNIGTLTKTATGRWSVTFDTAMPDAHYAVSYSGGNSATDVTVQSDMQVFSKTASGFSFSITDGTGNNYNDRTNNSFIVVR